MLIYRRSSGMKALNGLMDDFGKGIAGKGIPLFKKQFDDAAKMVEFLP